MTFYDVAKVVVTGIARTLFRFRVVGAEKVPKTGPLIVAPKLRAGIQLGKVGERLFKSPVLPVGRTPR